MCSGWILFLFFSIQIKRLMPRAAKTGSYLIADVCNATSDFSTSKLLARCDMETDDGKWMLIQRRINGTVNFNRTWNDYVYGFGDLDGEFWYGLERIHCLTTRDDVELRIELGYNNETEPTLVWTYQTFKVDTAQNNYRLMIGLGNGEGSKIDSMTYHNGRPFSTPDRDNSYYHCAKQYGSGWWWWSSACHHSNLNGKYSFQAPLYSQAPISRISWKNGGTWLDFTSVQMKIRPKRCSPNTCS